MKQTIQINVNPPFGLSKETRQQMEITCLQVFSAAARGAFDGFRLKDWKSAQILTPKQSDDEQTAAWYGRGEKPEHEPLDWVRFELIETAKPAKPGLFVVQGEGRYQGLGFNGHLA